MKLLNQNGMSLKPIAITLAVLGGLAYYIVNDIKKLQNIRPNRKSAESVGNPAPHDQQTLVLPQQHMAQQAIEQRNSIKSVSGTICGAVSFECRGSFVGETPNIPQIPASMIDGVVCEGQMMNQVQCIFTDFQRGFRLEGISCPEGHRPLTHPGHLSDTEIGEGATKSTTVYQYLMVLCVKR